MGMSTNEELITRQETAALLRISIRTLERWEENGKLTPTRLSPGVIRYRKDDVRRLIEEGAA